MYCRFIGRYTADLLAVKSAMLLQNAESTVWEPTRFFTTPPISFVILINWLSFLIMDCRNQYRKKMASRETNWCHLIDPICATPLPENAYQHKKKTLRCSRDAFEKEATF
jgi:hypothetical protein